LRAGRQRVHISCVEGEAGSAEGIRVHSGIRARSTHQVVVVSAAGERVVTAPTIKQVIAGEAIQRVGVGVGVVRVAVEVIVVGSPCDGIGAGAGLHREVPAGLRAVAAGAEVLGLVTSQVPHVDVGIHVVERVALDAEAVGIDANGNPRAVVPEGVAGDGGRGNARHVGVDGSPGVLDGVAGDGQGDTATIEPDATAPGGRAVETRRTTRDVVTGNGDGSRAHDF